MHHVSPNMTRRRCVRTHSFPPIDFAIHGDEMCGECHCVHNEGPYYKRDTQKAASSASSTPSLQSHLCKLNNNKEYADVERYPSQKEKRERGGNSTASHPETAQTLARVFITVAQLVSYSQLLCCWPLSASVPQLPRRCWVPLSLETDIVSRAKTTVDEKGNKFVFLFNRKKKKDNTQRVSLSFFLIINGWHVASSKRNRFSPSVRLLSLPRKFRLLENTETVWPNLPVAIMAEN